MGNLYGQIPYGRHMTLLLGYRLFKQVGGLASLLPVQCFSFTGYRSCVSFIIYSSGGRRTLRPTLCVVNVLFQRKKLAIHSLHATAVVSSW